MFEVLRADRETYKHYVIIIFGVITHTVLLMSIFDIYFQSPVLHGIKAIEPRFEAPARRVVLFISDGLRADKCFGAKNSKGKPAAPYLRSIATDEGVWGVSHTRVPTESRPGCVAITAGFYEDVSAITRGWKENPVEFDSVFNQSRYTWCWGSPDMLNMFVAKGRSNVFVDHYSQSDVDFGNEDPSSLDTWVLTRFKSFLKEAERDKNLADSLSRDKIVFFFHLLGADIVGHSKKPWSEEYVATIENVDRVVKDLVSALNQYYGNDDGTAFIFTADHGMTDWGSHGSSDAEETQTPLLAWGAGIRAPVPASETLGSDWAIGNRQRSDIRQADIAPLMSSLVGIPIPVNSVGVLPLNVLACREGATFCAEALVTNTRQLAAQFERHWDLKESNSLAAFFRPFQTLNRSHLLRRLTSLSDGVQMGGDPSKEAMELIQTILEGIRYFETYDRVSLCCCVVLGFLGWIAFICANLMVNDRRPSPHAIRWHRGRFYSFAVLATISITFCYVQKEPLTYFVYRLFPIATWVLVSRPDRHSFRVLCFNLTPEAVVSWIKNLAALTIALELIVVTFFRREALLFGLLLFGIYPLTREHPRNTNRFLLLAWLLVSFAMASFAFLPPVGSSTNYTVVILSGVISFSIAVVVLIWWRNFIEKRGKLVIGTQLILLALTIANKLVVAMHGGVSSSAIRISSWLLLVSSLFLPMFAPSRVVSVRLFSLSISFITPFLLLSYSYESLLCTLFFVLLALWWAIEDPVTSGKRRFNFNVRSIPHNNGSSSFGWNEIWNAYFALFLLTLAFFGMGNVANANSFSLDSVFSFVTVFRPFLMGALLLLKIILPFLAVACCVRSIQVVAFDQSPSRIFYLVLVLCDILALHFFFLVRDEGSWLEIGMSIGRFITAVVTTILFCVLYVLATFLTSYTFRWPIKMHSL